MDRTINPPVPSTSWTRTALPLFCLALVGTLLAASIILSKLAAVAAAPMLWFLTVLMAASGAVLLGIALIFGQVRGISGPLVLYGIVSGAFMAGGSALGYLTVSHVGASYISLIFAFPILLTYLMAVPLGMDRLSFVKLAAVGSGLTGDLVLALGKFDMTGVDGIGWLLLASTMPFIIALGNIYRTRYWPDGAGSVLLATLMLILGAAVLAPFAALHDGNTVMMLWRDPQLRLFVIGGTAIFCVQYVFYFTLQHLAGPVYLSQIGSVAAAIGAIIAFALLGETPPAGLAAAGALIAIGVVLFQVERVKSVGLKTRGVASGKGLPVQGSATGRC